MPCHPHLALFRRSAAALLATLLCTDLLGAQLTMSAQPMVSIGTVDGDAAYQLHRVNIVRRLSDGRILVVMGPDLRFFNAAGRHMNNAGGRGQGPGEFQYIQDLRVLPGDTLLVLNRRDKVWLDPRGKYLRQQAMDLGPLQQGPWFAEVSYLLPNGDLLAPQFRGDPPGGAAPRRELYRPPQRLVRLDLAKGNVQLLYSAGGLRQMAVGTRGNEVQPFSPYTRHAIGPDRIAVGDNDSTVVHRFTLDGRPLGPLTVADRPIPVTAAHRNAQRALEQEMVGSDPALRASLEGRWNTIPLPSRHPYWGKLLYDQLGQLWVSSPVIPDQRETWTVFDTDGRRVGAVTMPLRFTPHEIGADFVLGVARDEDNVEFVRMYGLRRGR
jgi:hypothetical protein